MKAILGIFVGKGESELREDFAFDEALYANSTAMYDAYAKTFFDIDMEKISRPYSSDKCPIKQISAEAVQKYFQVAKDHVRKDSTESSEKKESDPRVRAAIWNDYDHHTIHLPRRYTEMHQRITKLLENPMLPPRCSELLTEYIMLASKNLSIIGPLLADAAKDMPVKYPSPVELNKSTFAWLNNRYVNEFEDLKGKADEIVAFVRSHYDVDNLLRE